MTTEYKFTSSELESQITTFKAKGITEFSIHDPALAKDKKRILKIINLVAQYAPDLYVSILADASVLDREIAAAATQIFCSFDIPLDCTEKGGKLLFDKKFYSARARLLNDFGLVFGFMLSYAVCPGDTCRLF